jgi:hypothetical protein
MPLVSREVAESRGKNCAGCYANIRIQGCGPCQGLANYIAEVAGNTPTEADPFLEGKSCAYCHCASRANIWVPVEISQKGVSDEVLSQMPDGGRCWKRTEIEAIRAKRAT